MIILLMVIGGYSIVVILLMSIGGYSIVAISGYFINGYWQLLYWWILVLLLVIILMVIGCRNLTLRECEDETHTPEMGTWESSDTPKILELDCRGQNISP